MGQHFDGDMDMDTIYDIDPPFRARVWESTLRLLVAKNKKPAFFLQ